MTHATVRRIAFAEYERVKELYFPRWDRQGRWRLLVKNDIDGLVGRADPDLKRIEIKPMSGLELTITVIHEIAHAVAGKGHAKRWQDRMTKAAKHAASVGETKLGKMIDEEVDAYRRSANTGAEEVYSRIADAVHKCAAYEFEKAVELVRREYGLTREQFLHAYPKSRDRFETAREFALSVAQATGRRRQRTRLRCP